MVERNVATPDKLEGIALTMPHTYTITGHLEGVEDGTSIGLWLSEGSMFKRLVNMPLKNGMFFFTGSCTKMNVRKFWLGERALVFRVLLYLFGWNRMHEL